MIQASEQFVTVLTAFMTRCQEGSPIVAATLQGKELDAVRKTVIVNGRAVNAAIVGKSAHRKDCWRRRPREDRFGEVNKPEEMAHEKLSPVLWHVSCKDPLTRQLLSRASCC